MSKLNIFLPFEVAKDFSFRGKEYKIGDIFDYCPHRLLHRDLLRKRLLKEVSDKIQYICGKRKIFINETEYQPGQTITEETIPNIERLVKFGYLIKKLIEDPRETLIEVAKEVVQDILDNEVEDKTETETENQELIVKKYTDLAKKYELKFNQVKLLLENEFKIKVSSNGNIPEDKIALYEDFIKNQEIKQPEIIGE